MVFQLFIRLSLYCLFLLTLLNVPANRTFAQEIETRSPEESELTVKVNVDEVRIDAVVVDWRGRYVTDLTAEDFEIYQDGQPMEITSCRYIRYDQESFNLADSETKESSGLPIASTPIPKREDVRRTFVFLVDTLNMDFTNAYYTRMALRKYVEEQMKPGAYYVRVAVKDEGSGKHGSAYQYVEVPDLKKDRLTLSDIFISRGRGDKAKIEGVRSALKPYQPGETIGFMTEIYNARVKKRKPSELEYHYTLYKDETEILQSGSIKINTGSTGDRGEISIARELRLPESLEPGTYVLQLVVRDKLAKEKNGTAKRWMDFKITAP